EERSQQTQKRKVVEQRELQEVRFAHQNDCEYGDGERNAQEGFVAVTRPPLRKKHWSERNGKQQPDERNNAPHRETGCRHNAQSSHRSGKGSDGVPDFHTDLALVLPFEPSMSARQICKSADHLFVPILEVSVPLLRCIHCDVFAYHDTVKQLAKNRSYRVDDDEPRPAPIVPYWRRVWTELRRRFVSAGPGVAGS